MADTLPTFRTLILSAAAFLLVSCLFTIAASASYYESEAIRSALDGFAEDLGFALKVTAFQMVLSRMITFQELAPPPVPDSTVDLLFTAHLALFAAAFLFMRPIRTQADSYFAYYSRPKANVLGSVNRIVISIGTLKNFYFAIALGALLVPVIAAYGRDTFDRGIHMPVHRDLYYFLTLDLVLAFAYVFAANGIAAQMAEKRLGTKV